MPRTAQHYKLKVSSHTDERLDPLKSTEVAIKLLRDNYRIVKSWPLAITAYNHGTRNIRKTITELKNYDPLVVLDSINKRSFQFASRNFYPSYLAAVEIAMNKNRYFVDLKDEEIQNIEEFILGKRMSIDHLSKELKLTREEIRQFNPQITGVSWKKNFTLPKGFIVKYPNVQIAKALLQEKGEHQFSFESIKKWFDKFCGIEAQSIASNSR